MNGVAVVLLMIGMQYHDGHLLMRKSSRSSKQRHPAASVIFPSPESVLFMRTGGGCARLQERARDRRNQQLPRQRGAGRTRAAACGLGQQAAVARPLATYKLANPGQGPAAEGATQMSWGAILGGGMEKNPLSGWRSLVRIEIATHGDRCEDTSRLRVRGAKGIGPERRASADAALSVCNGNKQEIAGSVKPSETRSVACGEPGRGGLPSQLHRRHARPRSLAGVHANRSAEWGYVPMRGTLTDEEKTAQPWRCVRRFQSRPPAPGTR